MAQISIIVPVYNAGKYISKTVEAILSQKDCELELILVNDGSTDNSKAICEELARTNERIKFVTGENCGPGHARNIGIQTACGKYIGFCDSDDIPSDNMYSALLATLKENGADLAVCDIYSERDGKDMGFPWDDSEFCGKKDISRYVSSMIGNLSDNDTTSIFWGSAVRCLYRADILKQNNILFPEDISFAEDLVFNLRYLRFCEKISVCKRALYFYTFNKDSIMISHSSFIRGMFEKRKKLVEYIQKETEGFENYEEIKKRLCVTSRLYFQECIGNACRKSENRSFFDSYRDARKILSDKIVKDAFAIYDAKGKYGYLYFAIKHKMALCLCLYYKLRFAI